MNNLSKQVQSSQLYYASTDPQTIYSRVTGKASDDTDPLSDTNVSYWHTTDPGAADQSATCLFKDGSLHVTIQTPQALFYCTSGQVYKQFAFQVNYAILQGLGGGIVFRTSNSDHTYYLWNLDTSGAYRLMVISNNRLVSVLLEGKHISSFKTGYNQENVLTVIAYDSMILLYVNKHFVDRVKDNSFASGEIGLLSYNGDTTTDVSFTNAKVWLLS
ncbi:hypothetical protein KTT_50670 [Tengunoibacter tsumagoiensis]|uniref:3-keto-disaccharide hydrolase domain-containing protein n=2 Tax=Tengunoibacter tsumagoiensis TaxID=2014871 RepID=A0A402A7Z7_9CHLR|nr:hypothetical protein KTT_50670 [Tengunoibacter tsumagoiensis]